ncbi:MAG: M20/M25/M40 family metallo-hydrolase [Acidobacteria bacterium]|nr:M20/M25/M40 family metallo-hydrolase [Acidobacteriota bacterium]
MRRSTVLSFALAVCLAIVVSVRTTAEPTKIKVDGKIIKGYITFLAADEQQGRRTLTPGYEKMAEWAAGKFKEWGLKPAGENGTYFQKVTITGARSTLVWTTGVPSLIISSRAFQLREGDFTVSPLSTPGALVNADVVFVGYGISAPAKGLDEYAGIDVKGKIVVALKGSPAAAPAVRIQFAPPGAAPAAADAKDEFVDESVDQKKAMTAYEKGAAGIMLYDPPAPAAGFPGAAAARPAGGGGRGGAVGASPFKTSFVYVTNIEKSVFDSIMWTDPQESANAYGRRIGLYRQDIKNKKTHSIRTGKTAQLKGYASVSLYGEAFKNNFSRNVVAKIDGTDPTLKTQYVVLGGHLDHNGVRDGIVYNGADDNASGSAVVLEVARLMAVNKVQPKRTIIFGLWCGEEQGLLGSNYWAENPTDGVKMDTVVTNFNMDMVGLGDRIGAPGALNFPSIFKVIMKDQDPAIAKIVDASEAGAGGSDYSAFISRGIEALALMTSGRGGHPDYHDSTDDPSKIEADILGSTGQFVLQGALNVANETEVNLIVSDRLDQYNAQRFVVPDVAGEGGGGRGGWSFVRVSTNGELMTAMTQRIREMQAAGATAAGGRGGRGGGGGARYSTGVRGPGVFQGSIQTMEAAAALLNFGRIDVAGPDGTWFGEKLSADGKAALKAMEAANIVVNLVRPQASLLGDVLDNAQKPVMVTEPGAMDTAFAEKFKAKKALAIVVCDPADIDGCVKKLGASAAVVGKNNLMLSMGAHKDRAQITRTLYMSLLKAKWTRDEINAMVGVAAAGSAGAPGQSNLSRFSPAPAGRGGQ